jgi:uncharacterized protein YuzE
VKITYDPDADALYIELRNVPAEDSVDVEEGVTVDLDADGHIIGLEVLDAHERMGVDPLAAIVIERLQPEEEQVEPQGEVA